MYAKLPLSIGDRVYLIGSPWPDEIATITYMISDGSKISDYLFQYAIADRAIRHSGDGSGPDGCMWWGECGYKAMLKGERVIGKQFQLDLEV